jgi:hypothetical protein
MIPSDLGLFRIDATNYTWVRKGKARAGGGRSGCQGVVRGEINEPSEALAPEKWEPLGPQLDGHRGPDLHAQEQPAAPGGEQA